MTSAPFPASDFDDWAPTYDQDVQSDSFPFDGYSRVLETTLRLAEVQPGMSVLDLGVGTGNLSLLFYEAGCNLVCTDFSAQMLELAQRKLPQAVFVQADLREAWPQALLGPFDRIVSAYVFHHFELPKKILLLKQLSDLLAPNGLILIADLAFAAWPDLEAVRDSAGSAWEDEFYWIAEEVIPELANAGLVTTFQPVSSCAGVFRFPKTMKV